VGDKPVITVSSENGADASKWSLIDGSTNIWEYDTALTDVGQIFFNDGESWADKEVSDVSNNAYVTSVNDLLTKDLQFFSAIDPTNAATFSNNNAATVKGTLYLRCDNGNPGEIYDSIEFAERPYVISLPKEGKNITIDNLSVKFGGSHGICGNGISNLTVQNCEIAFIGGGIQLFNQTNGVYVPARYGNGVEVHGSCDGYTVENCWVHDIYDAGVTYQQGTNHTTNYEFKNITYKGNLIENCSYAVEYFAKTSEDGKYTGTMSNIAICDNIMRNSGSGFGIDRMESNYNMSAIIMGWHSSPNISSGSFTITGNIFDRSIKNNLLNGAKINSSLILVSAADTSYLPDFEGNTYIHYNGSSFAYYGINDVNLDASYFTKYTEGIDLSAILGDTTGEAYIAK